MGDITDLFGLFNERLLRDWAAEYGARKREVPGLRSGTISLDPPTPRDGCDPRLAAIWNRLGWPVEQREGAPPLATEFAHNPDAAHRFLGDIAGASNCADSASGFASRYGSSGNWSGAVLRPRAGTRFSAATARWRVPKAGLPAGATTPVGALPHFQEIGKPAIRQPDTWRMSVWVGLDGHRRASKSLPQIGTASVVGLENGQPVEKYYAWAQWWVRDGLFGEMIARDFVVRAGDAVTAWLALRNTDEVAFRMLNETTGQQAAALWGSGRKPASQGRILGEQAHPGPHPAEGAAAEWVVERPMVMHSTALYPLPQFDPVTMQDCIAAERDISDPPNLACALRGLSGARLIRLFDQHADPYRSGFQSVPDGDVAGERMTVRYRA